MFGIFLFVNLSITKQTSMKKISILAAIIVSAQFFAQIFIQTYQDRADLVTQENITSNITEFENFGIKRSGSVANNNAFNWLKAKYESFGYASDEISENAFNVMGSSTKNLIVTKTGTVYPDQFVIISGHYDTVNGSGANDNGSGVSVILEVARILKDIPTEYSIKFINFSGEEQGLLGSSHYVNSVVNATNPKMNIKLVFNIDQVGGTTGEVNNKITCERDESAPYSNNGASNLATQQLMQLVSLYSPLQAQLAHAYGSDYMPFQSNGEIITGFYESNVSPYPHSSSDTSANLDPVYVYNVAKAAVGATQHFAVAAVETLATDDNNLNNQFKIYPNPASDEIFLELNGLDKKYFSFIISDLNGRNVVQSENSVRIDVSKLQSGMYIGTLQTESEKISRKIIIK